MGEAYSKAFARWRTSAQMAKAQTIYLTDWHEAVKRGCVAQSNEDAALLIRALDIAEGKQVDWRMSDKEYNEVMKAMEIMEELNGDEEERDSDVSGRVVETS